MAPEPHTNSPVFCSQSKCGAPVIQDGLKLFSTCKRCREKNTAATRARRAKRKLEEETDVAKKRARTDTTEDGGASPGQEEESDREDGDKGKYLIFPEAFTEFKDLQAFFSALRHAFKTEKHVEFRGTYQTPEDPLVSDKEHVEMTIYEIWKNELPEAWAYLWENWYRPGRWQLWAHAEHAEIPRLKTTMMVESHWRRIKRDFLHHFHKPRLDLLVWILVVKLAPRYYRRLDIMMTKKGCHRDLPSWRKDFKSEWRRCQETPITLPLNPKYRPDPHKWHLVQAVHPVHRNRTTPFWSHASLRPLMTSAPSDSAPSALSTSIAALQYTVQGQDGPADDSDEELVEIRQWQTFDERLTSHLSKIRDFCDGLEYQRTFHDSHLLDTMERKGRERRTNSTRSAAPTTWEKSTANAMFYRTRPALPDRDT
ncbi:hypothetical protein DFH09DRAFT_1246058 [Mycena vulgaris]|nr:hypothetical protein DFH09DRAFT_1246058 [Mycena vulgaris]